MEALIIVAHGSKMKSSNEEIISIVEKTKKRLENENILVLVGFLELTEPSFYMAISNAIGKNCTKIKVFPYFLAAGKHVTEDIPCEIKKFKKQYPEVDFTVLSHIGNCNGIEDLITSNL